MLQSNDVYRRPPELPALTGIRFFLAIYVVLFHFTLAMLVKAPYLLQSFIAAGYSAVSMFFALSGYVLAYNHLDGRKLDIRRFWVARAARLLPAFFVAEMLTLLPLYALMRHNHVAGLIGVCKGFLVELCISFGFLQAWLMHTSLNAASWSLSCEVFFYLTFPILAVALIRLSRRWLVVACCVTATLSLTSPLLYLILNPDGVPYSWTLTQTHFFSPEQVAVRSFLVTHAYHYFYYSPIAHLPVFLFGTALGRYRRTFMPRVSLRSAFHRAMFLISAVALLGLLIFSRHLPVILIGVSLSGILFSLCILFCESAPRWLLRSLELRPLLFLGEASYALYILQDPVAGVMGSALHALMHLRMDESPKLTVVFIVALVVISAGVYEWIERPARIRLRKLAFGNVPAG